MEIRMFMGEFAPSLDDKGRVAVPVKLRNAFGQGDISSLVLTHGFDPCVMAYRKSDWQDFVENTLLKLPQSNSENRTRLRFLLGGAVESDLDKQGRILIPGNLQEYAGLENDLIIVGLYNRIEIWDRERYNASRPDTTDRDLFATEIGF
jgi:MraZ protein